MHLTTAPVLAYPDFSIDFKLETDASGAGLEAVLSQTQKDDSTRPIAFASRTLQSSEVNYGITEIGGPCSCLGSQTLPPVSVWPQVSGDHRS